MPADIRNFFGGNLSQSSQENKPAKKDEVCVLL
jgi:hypothetical protein